MPRYHFHCADGKREMDVDGTELEDIQSAQLEAIKFAGEVLRNEPEAIWADGQWRVEVTNGDNVLLFTLITLAIDAPKPGKI